MAQNHGGVIITFVKEKIHLCVVIVEPVYTSLRVCVCIYIYIYIYIYCVCVCVQNEREEGFFTADTLLHFA